MTTTVTLATPRRRTATGLLLAACLVMAGVAAAPAHPEEPVAADTPLDFTLAPGPRQTLELSLRQGPRFSTDASYAPAALIGLEPARLDTSPGPVRFALVREPGRFECAGEGGHARASGQCRFTPDAGFSDFLAAHGVARPSVRQSLQMATAGVGRPLVEAVAAARYPTPTPDQLAGLAALGVDRTYIAELAGRGYRPARLDDLVSLKAIGATPAYIDGLRRSGYQRLDAETMVQFRAMGITPAYLGELAAAGYGALAPSEVTQLRALGVDGAYIQGFRAVGQHPTVEQLVRMKALGVTPADVRSAAR